MPFPIIIKVLETKPPDATIRQWRTITKETYLAVGRHWYANMLPDHFKANARFVYGYRQRSKEYLKSKKWALKYGYKLGRKPVSPLAATMSLTVSGNLYRAMTASGAIVQAFPTRFKVKMPGLSYTPARQKTTTQPFLQGELTKLLKREIKVLARVGKKTALEMMKKARVNRTTISK